MPRISRKFIQGSSKECCSVIDNSNNIIDIIIIITVKIIIIIIINIIIVLSKKKNCIIQFSSCTVNRQLVNLIIKEKDFQKRQFFLEWSTDLSILILRDRLFQSLYSYVFLRQMDEIP